ncbi:MAG TPA: tetratricopeptide repeat protein, partial [Geothrix sp.]|nr:tetratricopeptide repeat protein [Geothrix sp.]
MTGYYLRFPPLPIMLRCFFAVLLGSAVLSGAAPGAPDFRLPTTDELPGASDEVRAALGAFENKDAGGAVKRLQAAAAKDDANAQFVLGLCLQYGQGVTQSLEQARAMYEKAAGNGQPAAQFFLGMFLLNSGSKEPESAAREAMAWLEKAALQKFHRANHQLADMYLNEVGVKRDVTKARDWLKKGSQNGDPVASYRLAIMNEKGEGLAKPDPEGALTLYEKAADEGLPEAMIYLGRMHQSGARGERDMEKARAYYEKAEKLKVPEARFRLGQLYQHGLGVEKDEARAVFYFRKGAEQNEPNCIFQLGQMAAAGAGTKKDEAEAREWFKRAAQMNFAPAVATLGMMNEEGQAGFEKNPKEALRYYVQAGELGDAASQNKLGVWYRSGEGPVLKDNVAAAAWFGLAVQSGYAAAQVNLGLMAEEGAGMPRNYALAGQLFEAAAAQGHALGMFFMGRLLESGRGAPPNPVGAFVLYEQAAPLHPPAAEARDALKPKL